MHKKELAEWGRASSGAGKKASKRRVGGLPGAAVGRDRRLQMDTTRPGLPKHAHLHCIRLWAAKQEFVLSPVSRLTHLLTKPKPKVLHPDPQCVFGGHNPIGRLGMECCYIALGAEKEKLNQQLKRSLERKVRRKINIELSRNFLVKVWSIDQQHVHLLGAY